MRKYKVILFDIDDTLLDFDKLYSDEAEREKAAMELLVDALETANEPKQGKKLYSDKTMDTLKAIFIGMARKDPKQRLTANEISSLLESIDFSNQTEKSSPDKVSELAKSANAKVAGIKKEFPEFFTQNALSD